MSDIESNPALLSATDAPIPARSGSREAENAPSFTADCYISGFFWPLPIAPPLLSACACSFIVHGLVFAVLLGTPNYMLISPSTFVWFLLHARAVCMCVTR